MNRPQIVELAAASIMEARRRWGWTLGRARPKVMSLDLLMAEAAVRAVEVANSPTMPVSPFRRAEGALLGERWTAAEAAQLIQLVEAGRALSEHSEQ